MSTVSKSIQLIYQDNKNKNIIKLNEEALTILRNSNGTIGSCVCVGPYRQGKSFVLNRLLKTSDAFKLGHTDKSETKGVWMYKEPMKVKDLNVFVFDTEGLESDDSTAEWDTKLFLISLLMSSMFLYNTKNSLTNDAFKKLSVMSSLCNRISVNEKSNAAFNRKKLKDQSPDFVWLVRDYALGQTMKPTEKLKIFLESEDYTEGQSSEKKQETDQRNEIREQMEGSFRTLNCRYIPVPVSDQTVKGLSYEKALQQIETIPFDNLREEFKKEVNEFCVSTRENIRPKMINEVAMNGILYAHFLEEIVSKLNDPKNTKIFLQDTITSCIQAVNSTCLEEAEVNYSFKMEDKMQNGPFEESVFKSIESNICNKYVELLKSQICGGPNILKEVLDKFGKFQEKSKNDFFLKNGKLNEAKNESCFEKVKKNYEAEMERVCNVPIVESALLSNELNIFNKYEQLLKREIFGGLNKQNEYLAKIGVFREKKENGKVIGGKLFELLEKNKKNSASNNEKIAQDLWNRELSHNCNNFNSFSDFEHELIKFEANLKSKLINCDFQLFWQNFLRYPVNKDGIEKCYMIKKMEQEKIAREKIEREKSENEKKEKQRIEQENRYTPITPPQSPYYYSQTPCYTSSSTSRPSSSASGNNGVSLMVKGEDRQVYTGSQGGQYTKTPHGTKVYLSDSQKQRLQKN